MNGITKFFTDRHFTGLVWLIIRLLLAYEWITAGWEKINSPAWVGAQVPAGIHGFLTGAVGKTGGAHPTVFTWYGNFLKNVALPNEHLFSYMVAGGELLIGLALLVGLFTKWAAFWGAFMNLNFLLAGTTSSNSYMLALEAGMLFAGLGVSFYGLDTFVLPVLRKALDRRPQPGTTPKPTLQQQPAPLA